MHREGILLVYAASAEIVSSSDYDASLKLKKIYSTKFPVISCTDL